MDAKEMERVQKSVHDLVDKIEDVMDGNQIGCIIPALIFLLAQLYDKEVMPKETYVKEITNSLNRYLSFDEEEGEASWLH